MPNISLLWIIQETTFGRQNKNTLDIFFLVCGINCLITDCQLCPPQVCFGGCCSSVSIITSLLTLSYESTSVCFPAQLLPALPTMSATIFHSFEFIGHVAFFLGRKNVDLTKWILLAMRSNLRDRISSHVLAGGSKLDQLGYWITGIYYFDCKIALRPLGVSFLLIQPLQATNDLG